MPKAPTKIEGKHRTAESKRGQPTRVPSDGKRSRSVVIRGALQSRVVNRMGTSSLKRSDYGRLSIKFSQLQDGFSFTANEKYCKKKYKQKKMTIKSG